VDLPARLIGLIDHFVLLTRPWQGEGRSPSEALEVLAEETRQGLFDPAAFRALVGHLSWFPLGSVLRLVDGRVVRIKKPDPRKPGNPVAEILEGEGKGEQIALPGRESVAEDLTLKAEVSLDS